MLISSENRPKLLAAAFGLVLTLVFWFWSNIHPETLLGQIRDRLDGVVYDTRLSNTLTENVRSNELVAIVDMDEKSLAEQGRWPWPRIKFAALLQGIADAGAAVTALDISFPDEDTNPVDLIRETGEVAGETISDDTLNDLENLRDDLDGDLAIANVVSNNDIVVGFTFNNEVEVRSALPKPAQILNDLNYQDYPIPEPRAILANVQAINDAARFQGFFSTAEDPDGVLRRYQLFNKHIGVLYPSLALEAMRVFLVADGMQIIGSPESGIESVEVGPLRIPADNAARTLIPFLGGKGAISYYSATDVLEGRLNPGDLDGKIVFVGSTAQSVSDFVTSPVQANYPGLEVHATMASAMLDENWKIRDGLIAQLGWVLLLLVGIAMSVVLPFLRPLFAVVVSIGAIVFLVFLNVISWSKFNIDFDVALTVILALLLTIFNVAYGFIQENFAKQAITGMFGQYVPPDLVKQMGSSPDSALSFDGERREMTVLFADIRNFTNISEGMAPGELKDMLNRYFTPMTQIIFEQQGTIDKYIGDMVMAFWGAPLDDSDHAVHGLTAALQMQAKSNELTAEFKALGYPQIKIGVGLNSGEMNVGNMGSEYRRSYTVLGDNVNLGSRVESLTKFYGADTLVAENTYQACRDHFVFRQADKVQVKGKEEAVTLYEPLGLKGEVSDAVLAELADYEAALNDYLSGDWKRASSGFTSLLFQNQKSVLYKLYRDRVTDNEPPTEGWDGVFRHTSK
ncbi:MAG: adenylate/guanylate cyclase domain-containing protein [Porticoccaceae bacterium]|jgi:adenylate cyclase|nr:adenylate/guanylate cyclase domain-containing protein [Porticoccaceae bacterium]